MKRAIAFVAVLLLVAVAAYGIARELDSRRPVDEWTWLRREFHLDHAQLDRIKALHAAYQPVCMGHCSRIIALRNQLAALAGTDGRESPEYLKTLAAWQSLRHECNEATVNYLQTVAAVMNPDDGRRYLAMMVPRVARPDRTTPLGIR